LKEVSLPQGLKEAKGVQGQGKEKKDLFPRQVSGSEKEVGQVSVKGEGSSRDRAGKSTGQKFNFAGKGLACGVEGILWNSTKTKRSESSPSSIG